MKNALRWLGVGTPGDCDSHSSEVRRVDGGKHLQMAWFTEDLLPPGRVL